MLEILEKGREHYFNSLVLVYLSLVNSTSGAPITGIVPNAFIRRMSDGFFFDGSAFLNTAGTPTSLNFVEISTVAAPGLYVYSFTDPGPLVPTPPAIQLQSDKYEIRTVVPGSAPLGGTLWDVRKISRRLRDVNTQGV